MMIIAAIRILIRFHFFARRFFLNRTQGKAVETATSTAPIVAGTIKIIITTRKTYKEVITEKENNECQQ